MKKYIYSILLSLFVLTTNAQVALDFDGSNDYATSNAKLNLNDNFTLEVYTQYRTGTDIYQTIIGFGTSVEIKLYNTRIHYVVNNSSGFLNSTVNLVNGQWYHIALVRRSGVWEMYIDGVYHALAQKPANGIGSSFWMGGRYSSESYNGIIDEVRVWTVPRTQAEISANMNSCLSGNEPDLFLYYQMEDGVGSSTIKDLTSGGNNATLNNMDVNTDWVNSALPRCSSCFIANYSFTATSPIICNSGSSTIVSNSSKNGDRYYLRDNSNDSIIDGPVLGTGGAISLNTGTISTTTTYNIFAESGDTNKFGLDFDGSNDYATSNAKLNLNDNFTLEVYTQYRTGTDIYQTIIGFGTSVEIKLYNARIQYVVNNSSGFLNSAVNLVNGQWYHIALVRRAGVWEMYINGVYHALWQKPANGIGSSFWMGGRYSSESYNGIIDEVRVWTVPRTQAEISANMTSCLKGTEPGLFLYYNMEDGTGSSSVNDLASGGNDAVITNMDVTSDWVTVSGITCQLCSAEMNTTATVVNNGSSSTEVQSACNSYTWTNGDGNTYFRDTIVTHKLGTNSMGCDSILVLELTVEQPTYGSYATANCFNYVSPSGKTWTTSGVFQDTIPNAVGCDSVLTITLTILDSKKTVMNGGNSGLGSLRDLVSMACPNDTIVFDPSTDGNPIQLTTGQIVIDKDIVIIGNDSASTIIDGGSLGRIFYIAPGVTVTMDGVKLQNGQTKEGGAIYNRGNLTLNAIALTNNKAKISNLGHTKGGAIYNTGRITITNSSLIGNSAIANGVSNSYGGAIYNGWRGSFLMTNCIAKSNCVASFHGLVLGGVIYNGRESKFELTNSLMSGNKATSQYYGFGGAIVHRRKVVSIITNCTFMDNTSTSKNDEAIYPLFSPNSVTIIGSSSR